MKTIDLPHTAGLQGGEDDDRHSSTKYWSDALQPPLRRQNALWWIVQVLRPFAGRDVAECMAAQQDRVLHVAIEMQSRMDYSRGKRLKSVKSCRRYCGNPAHL
jgi:hypothetical protein